MCVYENTGQPDCVDPDKAKLLDRVAELEERLAAIEAERKPRCTRRRIKRTKGRKRK